MRSIIAVILSITMIFSTVAVSDNLLKEKSESGIKQGLAMYEQPENTIDVVLLGSSHIHCGVNTAKLWNDYGIAAYDFSSAEQSLWVSYYYLKELCKYQSPKVVVLDFFSPAAFQDDYDYKYYFMADTLYGIRFSANKLEMMNVCFDGKIENWDKYFPSYFGYHDRYDDVEAAELEEFWNADYSTFKGYSPVFKTEPQDDPVIDTGSSKAPCDKSVEYLNKIIEYTKERDMQLYITIVPYRVNVIQQEGLIQEEDKRFNWLENYVNELNAQGDTHIHFDYTLKHMSDIGLDFTGGTDIADGLSHLNYYGSTKFAAYLAEDLRSIYGTELIPDNRGDAAYSSWDGHVEEIKSKVLENGWEWR